MAIFANYQIYEYLQFDELMLKYSLKMGKCITLLYMLLLLLPMSGLAADNTRYLWLARKVDGMTSEKVMKMAGKYADKGKQGEALVLYAVVYGRFNDGMDDEGKNLCSQAHLNAGSLYYGRGDYVEALDEFVNGVKLSEQCAKPRYAAQMYNYIGNVYCMFLDWEKGLDYYKKAYHFAKKHSGKKTCHDILVNMTGVYTFLGDMANARKYYNLSEETKDSADPEDVYMSGYTLSLIQIKEGYADKGIARLKRLAGYAVEKKLEPKYQCFAYQEIYGAYDGLQMPDSLLKYMELCDITARRYNLQHTFATTLKSLSEFYESKGDVAMSNKYKSRYLDIMDSIYDIRRFDAVRNSLFTYEVGKTTKEIADLRTSQNERMQTIRMQRVIMCTVAIVAFITILFLLIVWKQKKRIHKSYINLYKINQDFIQAQEQLTSRLRKCRAEINEKNDMIDNLRQELGNAKGTEESTSEEGIKYQTSKLTDGQMQTIADAIGNVMENTTEFCDCNFSLSKLADLVGSNTSYVSQVINDSFQKTFNDYVTPYRIHMACKRLTDRTNYGNFTMKAIAESVGFKSYTTFVNAFKKITGITPSIYQKLSLIHISEPTRPY